MPIQFAVLASGSGGNASLVTAGHAGLLIDLGLGVKDLAQRLEGVGSSPERIGAAILTHTHGDHVQTSALRLLAKHKIPLYCHEGHRRNLADRPGFGELAALGLARDYDDRPFLTRTGHRIEPVELSHDGGPTFGFRVEGRAGRGSRPVAIGYLTDTGCWSDATVDTMTDVVALGVEFNHDVTLQLNSGRSPHLIWRNLGDRGHLSNDQGAGLVAAILERSKPGSLRNVVLLHLSDQCNRPKLAIDAARQAVQTSTRRVIVHAARQGQAYPNLHLNPARKVRPASSTLAFPWELE